jgi:hypothetical protein
LGAMSPQPCNLRKLLDVTRSLIPVEPLLGIDQEGGLVDRLRKICTPMPSARTIRQHGDLPGGAVIRANYRRSPSHSRFNMNFAPVMSIMTDERDLLSNGLYSRSFGRSPGEVLGYSTVYMRVLQGTGCLGCLKHSPSAKEGEISEGRLAESLDRIATIKSLIQPPLPFDTERFQELSDEVAVLNGKLNYSYGGANWCSFAGLGMVFLILCSTLQFAGCLAKSYAFVIALSDPISTLDPIG